MEATIVFPVCLIVILMLLYLGNVYYQKSRIEAIVVEAALDGAAYCADPLLWAIQNSDVGQVPGLGTVDYEPYRYLGGLFGGMNPIEESVSSLITSRIGGMNTGLFSGMKPTGYGNNLQVEYKSSFIASSISVDLEYKIELPIRLLGDRDTPEFIRNVNMVDDIFEVTGAKEAMTNKITELRQFVKDLFHK